MARREPSQRASNRPFRLAAALLFAVLGSRPVDVAGCNDLTLEQGLSRGRELRRQGRPEEALQVFRCLHRRAPVSRVLVALGATELALARWLEAEAHYTEALAGVGDPYIQANRKQLEGQLAQVRQHLGELEVLGPPGATVWISGRQVATLPMPHPLRMPTGLVFFDVRKEGSPPVSRQARIDADRVSHETVILAPPKGPRSPSPRARKVLGFSAVGLALAAVGGGIAGWVLRERYVGMWNDDDLCLADPLQSREDQCSEWRLRREQADAVTVSSFVIGGVLAGGAAALLVSAYRDGGRATRVHLMPGPGQLGLGLEVQF